MLSRCIPVIPRTYKLQEKPSALTRKHPPLKKMKFLNCFIFFWAIFALLDLYRVCGSGSGDSIESGSNPNPDPNRIRIQSESGSNPNPDPIQIRIHKTGLQIKHPFKLLCVKKYVHWQPLLFCIQHLRTGSKSRSIIFKIQTWCLLQCFRVWFVTKNKLK
jgi:hypothetical protein